jgi:SAM-dependent methyltransferase
MAPLLESHFAQRSTSGLACLHLAAPDDDECAALRERGHKAIAVPADGAATGERLPYAEESFDFIFTNAFGVFANTPDERRSYAQYLRGLLRPGGALLMSIGNRLCPIDLCRAPGRKATLAELEDAFGGSWSQVRLLSANGYFGWSKIPKPFRPLLFLAKSYVRWATEPSRRRLYGSPLNSFFVLWIVR